MVNGTIWILHDAITFLLLHQTFRSIAKSENARMFDNLTDLAWDGASEAQFLREKEDTRHFI